MKLRARRLFVLTFVAAFLAACSTPPVPIPTLSPVLPTLAPASPEPSPTVTAAPVPSATEEVVMPTSTVPPVSSSPTAGPDTPGGGPGTNPFGVMYRSATLSAAQQVAVLQSLGVAYYRPLGVFLDRGTACVECQAAARLGLKLVLTVRANGGPQTPTTPPADLAAYRASLSQVVTRYRPAVLVVENEPNSQLFYTGTPEQYLAELRAACEVAHAATIACADGGMVSSLVAILMVKNYWDAGNQDYALQLAQKITPAIAAWANRPMASTSDLAALLQAASAQIGRGRQMLDGFRAAGTDYVNFHWYVPDALALRETIAFLRRVSGGLPVLCNEAGQRDESAATTEAIATTLRDQGVAPIIWYSLDVGAGARSLVNPDGTLRPSGEEFRKIVQGG